MHYMKINRTTVWRVLAHDSRKAVQSRSNENIDSSRTKLNYNLCKKNEYEYYKQRLNEIKVQNRKDVNTLCSWVVTVPKDLDKSEHEKFFKYAYKFLEEKYKSENVVSGWVHNDETTPHLHFKFIPSVEDKKHPGKYKCSAYECVTRADLKSIHKEMSKFMEKVFGRDVGILNGSTVGGNKTITELKLKEMSEEKSKLQTELFDARRTLKEAGRILSKEQLEKIEIKETLFNKDKALIDSKIIRDLEQTIAQYKSIEEAERKLESKEASLNEREANIDKQMLKLLEQRELQERLTRKRIKEVAKEELDRLKSSNDFIENIKYSERLSIAEQVLQDHMLIEEYKELLNNEVIENVRDKITSKDEGLER